MQVYQVSKSIFINAAARVFHTNFEITYLQMLSQCNLLHCTVSPLFCFHIFSSHDPPPHSTSFPTPQLPSPPHPMPLLPHSAKMYKLCRVQSTQAQLTPLPPATLQLHYSCTLAALKANSGYISAALPLHTSCTPAAIQLNTSCTTAALPLHSSCTTATLQLHYSCTLAALKANSGYTPAALPLHTSCTTAAFQLHSIAVRLLFNYA